MVLAAVARAVVIVCEQRGRDERGRRWLCLVARSVVMTVHVDQVGRADLLVDAVEWRKAVLTVVIDRVSMKRVRA